MYSRAYIKDNASTKETSTNETSSKSPQAEQSSASGHLLSLEDIAAAALSIHRALTESHAVDEETNSALTAVLPTLSGLRERQSDIAWTHLSEIAEMAATRASAARIDILSKIVIWRTVAPEEHFDRRRQTSDEMLLCSIIDDVERMLGDDRPSHAASR